MNTIRSIRLAGLVLAATAVLGATPAAALRHDHLKCFKAKDSAALTAVFDLRPADDGPLDIDAGCTVKVRSRQICFPVDAALFDASGPTLFVDGQELSNPFFCYSLKCPNETPPAEVQMTDLFGTRTLTGLRASTVCTPAVIGVPTTTTTLPGTPRNCVDATPPNCDGTCNDFNGACKPDASGTACTCAYVDVFGDCPMPGSGVPECWGSCSGSLSCIGTSGACQCGLAY